MTYFVDLESSVQTEKRHPQLRKREKYNYLAHWSSIRRNCRKITFRIRRRSSWRWILGHFGWDCHRICISLNFVSV